MTILAKSASQGRELDLYAHSASVLGAAELLFGKDRQATALAKAWLRFFGLGEHSFPAFIKLLRLACAVHDIGKANSGFQRAVRRQGDQIIRHEHLSGLLLRDSRLATWIESNREIDIDLVVAAVVSHHLKASHEEFGTRLIEGEQPVAIEMAAAETRNCFKLAAEVMHQNPPDLNGAAWTWDRTELDHRRDEFKRVAHMFKRRVEANSQRHRMLVALKAALIAADAAASALFREGVSLEKWLGECFGSTTLTPTWVEQGILQPRIREIEHRHGRPFCWHDFQVAAGQLGQRALLLSACGTGKTLAAWKWVQAQLQKYSATRVVFLYPTRATATEGFRDYVSWAGDEAAALLHGTAEFDLSGMFENPGDPRRGGDYHVRQRLYALGYWPKQVFSATVDGFLAFIRNQYASMCMLPVLCDSVVVIDEVHSFDQSMFTALERFLEFFDLPVLCMTATLSEDRKRILTNNCGLEIFPREAQHFEDLQQQASLGRYRLAQASKAEIESQVRQALASETRVLWVVNTVARCQEIALSWKNCETGPSVLCYHSRFRLMDRKQRHEQVIGTFRQTASPLLLVTTQVCEMSLDIDADLLVTESAPVPSLIQRMGRCCREPIPRNGRLGQVLIYRADGDKPYESEEMRLAEAFVSKMAHRKQPLSQAVLAQYLEQMDVVSPLAAEGFTGFLDSGMYAMARDESFREGDDFTVDCVLDTDMPEYLEARRGKNPAAIGFIVPVPRPFASENPKLGGFIREAPGTHYDPFVGFRNEVVTNA
jgi:CRISPR-associated endonuclease/helicase Cas3